MATKTKAKKPTKTAKTVKKAEKPEYVYTKKYEYYSHGVRKAGEPIAQVPGFEWTPENINLYLSRRFIEKKCVRRNKA